MLKFMSVFLLFAISILIIFCKKFLRHTWDKSEARRKSFPVLDGRRSHPAPQVCWHPALKIKKQANGLIDDERVENSLHREAGIYRSKLSGISLYWQSYRPKNVKDVTHGVVILHGYGNHCDYNIRQYALTLAALNNAWVFTFDSPGHGRSDGLWALISDWNLFIEEGAEIVRSVFLPELSKLNRPVFCWGESQGGAVAIHMAMSSPKLFRGLVLSCPMCGIADEVKPPSFLIGILLTAARFAGRLPVTPSNKDISLLMYKDQEVYQSMKVGVNRNLLLYQGKTRLATARELLRGSSDIIRRAATEMVTPFFLLHGDCDYVCPIQKSKEFYENAAVEDKSFEVVRGGWHGLLHNHNTEKTYALIFNWINQRLK